MADYLAVPFDRQERAVHEKARSARRGELRWLRTYIEDVLDEPDLFGEPSAVRFLDVGLVALAAKSDWMLLYDPRWIASRFGLRSREVKPAIERLLELGRLEIVTVSDENRNGNGIQPALFPSLSTGTQEPRGNRPVTVRQPPGVVPVSETPLEESRVAAQTASQRLAQTRSREDLDLERSVRQETEERQEISNETNPVTTRLVRIAKLDANSARFVHRETQGLPDAAIVSVIESYLRKSPKPTSKAGWIVNALRAQRAERSQARAVVDDPEPEV